MSRFSVIAFMGGKARRTNIGNGTRVFDFELIGGVWGAWNHEKIPDLLGKFPRNCVLRAI